MFQDLSEIQFVLNNRKKRVISLHAFIYIVDQIKLKVYKKKINTTTPPYP